jgi:hypothetical protein
MARKIYWMLGILSSCSLILVLLNHEKILAEGLIWATAVLFMLIVTSIHGIIAHSLTAHQKGSLIFYPILMGILFGLLASIYMMFIMRLLIK